MVVYIQHGVCWRGDAIMSNVKPDLIHDEMSEKIIEAASRIAVSEGVHNISVRKVLNYLGITNRVFYNRFHNIEEVLNIVSENSILEIRKSLRFHFDESKDFFEQIMDEVEKTLIISYETRMNLAHYVFENDSVSSSNYQWWTGEIKKILNYAMEHGLIKKVDPDMTSYAVWCFIRGFNTDAIGRKLPIDEALKRYRYGFKFILNGLKT